MLKTHSETACINAALRLRLYHIHLIDFFILVPIDFGMSGNWKTKHKVSPREGRSPSIRNLTSIWIIPNEKVYLPHMPLLWSISSTCLCPVFGNANALGGDSQNFLRKFVRFFVTLGLKILRLNLLKVLFEADI